MKKRNAGHGNPLLKKTMLWAAGLVVFCLTTGTDPLLAAPQATPPSSSNGKIDKSAAYFNYSMAHIFSDLAAASGNRSEYVNQAIEYYKGAIKADPSAGFLSTELSDLYVQSGQGNRAVTEAEAALKANPNDISSRRILGRIYARLIGDPQANRIREDMVRKALDQYTKVAELDPTDADAWVMLGRLHKVGQNNAESEKAYKKALEIDSDNDDALSGLAMNAADSGDAAAAASLLEKANAKTPNLRSLSQLAETYEQMKDFKNAAKTWQRALDMSGGNPEIKRALANDYVMAGLYDEAVKVYEEIVEDEPRDVQSVLRVSQIYLEKRNFAKAREYSKKAKDLDPGNVDVRYNEVSILDAEGKSAEAIASMKELLESSARKTYLPQEKTVRTRFLERLGILQRSAEQYPDAVKSFEEIASLEPSSGARAAIQIVETYRQAKDFNKAEAVLDEAIRKNASNRDLKLMKGAMLAEQGKVQQGADYLQKQLDGKEDREVFIGIAQVWEKGKNFTEMGKALDQAEKLSSAGPEKNAVIFMRGAMLEKQKNFEAAEQEFRKVLKEDPNNAGALNYLGYMLVDKGTRIPEAFEMIKKAVDLDPQNSAYLDSLGWAYFRMDKYEEAEKYLQMSLERLSKDPTVHDHLGDVYFKQGKLKEAIGQWERSLAEWANSSPSDRDPVEVAKVQKKLDGAKVRFAKEPGSGSTRKKN